VRALTIKGTGTASNPSSTIVAGDASTTAPIPLSVDQALQALSQ
jgi:hypothetical protein